MQMLRIILNIYGLPNPFFSSRSSNIEQISWNGLGRAPLSTLGLNQLLQILNKTSVAGISFV